MVTLNWHASNEMQGRYIKTTTLRYNLKYKVHKLRQRYILKYNVHKLRQRYILKYKVHKLDLRMYLWWSLYTLHSFACQARVTQLFVVVLVLRLGSSAV